MTALQKARQSPTDFLRGVAKQVLARGGAKIKRALKNKIPLALGLAPASVQELQLQRSTSVSSGGSASSGSASAPGSLVGSILVPPGNTPDPSAIKNQREPDDLSSLICKNPASSSSLEGAAAAAASANPNGSQEMTALSKS